MTLFVENHPEEINLPSFEILEAELDDSVSDENYQLGSACSAHGEPIAVGNLLVNFGGIGLDDEFLVCEQCLVQALNELQQTKLWLEQ